ncbi:phosphopantetheine-binding protein [Actinokineospora guangxiensis]|uniref:Phosphopantetheine-binding protein n=1 Tax=Actinokineospora guangxiensis TaxID=1490288 RepID=A0ABW0EQG7_9PSEU
MTPESLLADVAEMLDVDPAGIGADDDLVDLGLDSMRLMTLAETWRQQGVDADVAALMEQPTLAGWQKLLTP